MKRMLDPKDTDKEKRLAVPLTNSQREKIMAAMAREGIKSMSDYLRFAALERARVKE